LEQSRVILFMLEKRLNLRVFWPLIFQQYSDSECMSLSRTTGVHTIKCICLKKLSGNYVIYIIVLYIGTVVVERL
jgi:hypothetical protein